MRRSLIFVFLFIVYLSLFFPGSIKAQNCTCDHTIPLGKEVVDGNTMDISPGDIICIQGGKRRSLWLKNFKGTEEKPLTFINCEGQVVITNTTKWGFSISNSKFFTIDGTGDSGFLYGFKIEQAATVGLSFNRLTTDFEAHHIEITKALGAGCVVKTDPECGKPETQRGKFLMKNVNLHNFYIHDVGTKAGGGEGFYIGHSFYNGIDLECGKLYPHNIENLKVHDNIIENTAFDAMQVSCAISGVEVYNNKIKNFGLLNNGGQQSGIVIGGGTKGKFYNNSIHKGTGMGICVFGQGDVYVFNNVVSNTGKEGIFVDDRGTDKSLGFYCFNNTVVNTKSTGIISYNSLLKTTLIYNNLVVNPGNYEKYSDPRKSFIYLENQTDKRVKFDSSGNYICRSLSSVHFVDPASNNYQLRSTSPAIDKGIDLSAKGVTFDAENKRRPISRGFDPGAYEYGGSPVVAKPKVNKATLNVSLETKHSTCNSANGKASAKMLNGAPPFKYLWSNGKTSQSVYGLAPGEYWVIVTDKKGIQSKATTTIQDISSIKLTPTIRNATSNAKGYVRLTVTGGTAPYSYKWSTGSNGADLVGAEPGDYTVTVKDSNNCTRTLSVTVKKDNK